MLAEATQTPPPSGSGSGAGSGFDWGLITDGLAIVISVVAILVAVNANRIAKNANARSRRDENREMFRSALEEALEKIKEARAAIIADKPVPEAPTELRTAVAIAYRLKERLPEGGITAVLEIELNNLFVVWKNTHEEERLASESGFLRAIKENNHATALREKDPAYIERVSKELKSDADAAAEHEERAKALRTELRNEVAKCKQRIEAYISGLNAAEVKAAAD